jgi:hypothetical protein
MASDERRLYKGTPAGVTGGGEVKRERPNPVFPNWAGWD